MAMALMGDILTDNLMLESINRDMNMERFLFTSQQSAYITLLGSVLPDDGMSSFDSVLVNTIL